MVQRLPYQDDWLVLGRVNGLYGIAGWVKVYSHTEPREGILDYHPLHLFRQGQWQAWSHAQGRRQGKGLIVKFDGIDDRDSAARLIGTDIGVRREQLPPPAPGEYYWADLQGLRVRTREGHDLGTVSHLIATGANDVLVVRGDRERLLPFTQGQCVLAVDLAAGYIDVDWDPDF